MQAQKWILAQHFDGEPKDSDLELKDETLPPLKDGEVLFEAITLSVDPYMRAFGPTYVLGQVLPGDQIARIKESKHADHKTSELYLANLGWRTHTIVNMDAADKPQLSRLPDMSGLSPSLALSILGMPGVTGHCGLLDIGQPKSGDVVLVSGAAGAVGSVVGQIAKIKGCTVIGSAGSKEKVTWLKSLGFDHVFNYKECDQNEAIKQAAPGGVDIYYDNVGGVGTLDVIRDHMRSHGRVIICGSISTYNTKMPEGPIPFVDILMKSLKVQGIVIFEVPAERWQLAQKDIKDWILQGKLQFKEHVTTGFHNMRSAFYSLFTGENFGKAIVNVGETTPL